MTSGINEFEEQAYKQLNEFRGYKKTTNWTEREARQTNECNKEGNAGHEREIIDIEVIENIKLKFWKWKAQSPK
jgi:hypothetical protein